MGVKPRRGCFSVMDIMEIESMKFGVDNGIWGNIIQDNGIEKVFKKRNKIWTVLNTLLVE